MTLGCLLVIPKHTHLVEMVHNHEQAVKTLPHHCNPSTKSIEIFSHGLLGCRDTWFTSTTKNTTLDTHGKCVFHMSLMNTPP